ncbi:MAG: orotidine-5'-phosphate decarboxylase, partial [Acidimicrobiia bacterium]
ARQLREYFGIVKVGLELFSAAGPEAVGVFVDDGFRVFLDLKLHDIPNTVRRASRVVGSLGASMVTVHTASGVDVARAAVEGLNEGASAAGGEIPIALGVTILTSEKERPDGVLRARIGVAVEAGCGGLVCGATEVAGAKALAPDLIAVVPGIRMPGSDANDQSAVATPEAALAAGADILVIGRTVTAATDRVKAAEALVSSLA